MLYREMEEKETIINPSTLFDNPFLYWKSFQSAMFQKGLLSFFPMRNINYSLLADKTKGFSGADIQAVVQLALEKKLREELYSQKRPRYVVDADLFQIIEKYIHVKMRYREKSTTQIYV